MIHPPVGEQRPGWLSPLIYLTNNWLSLIGVVIVTTATVSWLFLLPTTLSGEAHNPYIGILAFLLLPGVFFAGLLLIPLGIYLRRRRDLATGRYPSRFPPINLRNPEFRRLLTFIGLTTVVNIVIASQLTYGAVTYMESVTFCGQTCHTVMQPEFTAYQNSPHSRVECVKCHIGPGASWFVRSKLSGVGQVFAVTFNTYERPIPTPVQNLRPARETCETCHWPQKYGEDRLRVITKFADDETNTMSKTVLLMKIGGGNRGVGIHGTHLGPGIRIRYAHPDPTRQVIPWVEYTNVRSDRQTVYTAEGTKTEVPNIPIREMDCMDCHNRPSHAFELPDRAVDRAMLTGAILPSLPFARKKGVDLLKQEYPSRAVAAEKISAGFVDYYRTNYPELYKQRQVDVEYSAKGLVTIYERNVFPAMELTWGTYPNNIGHSDFPGCFRCHDEQHTSPAGQTISQDCNSCHTLLAMDESSPQILSELGVTESKPPEQK